MSDWHSIAKLVDDIKSGKTTASQNVETALKNISDNHQFNPVISTIEVRARERAALIDEQVRQGKNVGRLAGIPFIAKDNFLTFGSETTAASNILRGFNAPYQATAIEKLEAEGAICVAKANLDAFAHGGSTENSDFGVTLNPSDPTRVAGGSSGGSAACVALGIVPFALGTDTGGSIREPSSFCGVVGLKPTYGLVSRYGVVAMASSTDVIGPIASRVEDAAYVLNILAGKDIYDSTTIDRQNTYVIDVSKQKNSNRPKVGVIKEFLGEGVDQNIKNSVNNAIERLVKDGYEIVEVSIPSISMALACYYIIVPAEVSSNLSRYDGLRYGFTTGLNEDGLEQAYSKTRSLGFNPENKRRIMIGTYVLSSGYYDAYYKKAAKVRTKLINEFKAVFDNVDILIGPTVPEVAPRVGENSSDPLKMYMLDLMTVSINLVGVPAISIPIKQDGEMPIGLQIITPMRKDKELLDFAYQIEEVVK